MFREKDIVDCLIPVVGWRQNSSPEYNDLLPSLLISETGKEFQSEHPLVCIENLDQAFKNYDRFVYPDYEPLEIYFKTQHVTGSDSKVYESMVDDNEGNDPVSSPTEWKEFEPFNQKLESLTRASVLKVVTTVFLDKTIRETSKTLVSSVLLFEGAGNMANKEIKKSRFVGLEVVLSDNRDLGTIIRRLGTQFSEANPDFKLYIFHSSQVDPIYIIDMELEKANSFEWTSLKDADNKEINLRFNMDEYAPGGSFYIGYYEDDLVGMAINRNYDFYNAPSCTSCGNNYAYWQTWSAFVSVAPFFVSSADLVDILPGDPGGPAIWDVAKNQYQYATNFGLNLDLSVRCDVTEFLCKERDIFADAISKQVAVDVLRELAYSTRNNVISKETRELAIFALANQDNKTPGLEAKLESAIKAISFNFSGLNSICLPCEKKLGINWKTI